MQIRNAENFPIVTQKNHLKCSSIHFRPTFVPLSPILHIIFIIIFSSTTIKIGTHFVDKQHPLPTYYPCQRVPRISVKFKTSLSFFFLFPSFDTLFLHAY